jgi:cardiolipin synthase A/B
LTGGIPPILPLPKTDVTNAISFSFRVIMNAEPVHWSYQLISTVLLLADFTIRIGFSIRVIMRKRSHGVSLAWLVVIQLFPFAGGIFYLLFGENRIPEKRIERTRLARDHYQHWLKTLIDRSPVNWQLLSPECQPLHNLAQRLAGLPAMAGNHLQIIESPEKIIGSIIRDIDQAQSTCHLQFYIWEEGGMVDKVTDALLRAARRGVICRVLLDAIGSRDFLTSETAKVMKDSEIRIQESLPAGIIKALFARIDIRNHRKIVVIDGHIAYTGSQNMADPYVFRQDAGVGNWIDVMIRIQGPVVESLAGTFINDWFLEADIQKIKIRSLHEDIDTVRQIADIHSPPPAGKVAVQLVPSGPGFTSESIHILLLTTIYAARKELILTTPYFIPDEALLNALISAALRGVEVSIILPVKNESKLAEYATRARLDDLLRVGVQIYMFAGGFLHAKTITVDGDFSLFGSVNLDMRSFWLNFEATLVIYNQEISQRLRSLQLRYMESSCLLDHEYLASRSLFEKFKENAVLLIGPLL